MSSGGYTSWSEGDTKTIKVILIVNIINFLFVQSWFSIYVDCWLIILFTFDMFRRSILIPTLLSLEKYLYCVCKPRKSKIDVVL